jgi:hypothetical protein
VKGCGCGVTFDMAAAAAEEEEVEKVEEVEAEGIEAAVEDSNAAEPHGRLNMYIGW